MYCKSSHLVENPENKTYKVLNNSTNHKRIYEVNSFLIINIEINF